MNEKEKQPLDFSFLGFLFTCYKICRESLVKARKSTTVAWKRDRYRRSDMEGGKGVGEDRKREGEDKKGGERRVVVERGERRE